MKEVEENFYTHEELSEFYVVLKKVKKYKSLYIVPSPSL